MAAAEVVMPPHQVAYLPTDLDIRNVQLSTQHGIIPRAPANFPSRTQGKLVWRGAHLEKKPGDWVVELSSGDITTIETALHCFQAQGVSPSLLDDHNFPLPPGLAERLEGVSAACYDGVGFAVVRGLDPERYTEEQNSIIFAGLAHYVAASRGFQDYKREHVLCHIVKSHGNTPAFSDGAMAFHTDTGEILALSSLKVAPHGGATLLASVWQIYNDLAEANPEALQTLSEDWVFDTHQDYSQFPPFTRPVLYAAADGKVMAQLSRYRLTGYGNRLRNPALPPLSTRQVQALNAFQLAAANNCMRLPTQPGDMLFINNLAVVHGREAFFAGDSNNNTQGSRHVLKLFLRDPRRSWEIPDALKPVWEELYGANRANGMREESWILDNTSGASQEKEWSSNG